MLKNRNGGMSKKTSGIQRTTQNRPWAHRWIACHTVAHYMPIRRRNARPVRRKIDTIGSLTMENPFRQKMPLPFILYYSLYVTGFSQTNDAFGLSAFRRLRTSVRQIYLKHRSHAFYPTGSFSAFLSPTSCPSTAYV